MKIHEEDAAMEGERLARSWERVRRGAAHLEAGAYERVCEMARPRARRSDDERARLPLDVQANGEFIIALKAIFTLDGEPRHIIKKAGVMRDRAELNRMHTRLKLKLLDGIERVRKLALSKLKPDAWAARRP